MALSLRLNKEGITDGLFHVEGILRVCEVFGLEAKFKIQKVADQQWLVQADDDRLRRVIELARRTVSMWGVATVADLCAQVNLAAEHADIVRSLLHTSLETQWLDSDRNWFWLPEVPRNRVLNAINKILSVAPILYISELRQGVGRNYRMEGVSPPARVLSALCSRLPYCRVESETVHADPAPDWQERLSGTEKIFFRILRQLGPVMSRADLEERCTQAGMARSTFYVSIDNSPILSRFARGVYGLRGARVPPGMIPELQKPISRSRKILIDAGWTQGGKIWVAYRISEGLLNSGVCSLPTGFKKYLQGSFELRTKNNSRVGTIKIKDANAWGLGPFFTRRGGEPGDILRLEFDLELREAEVKLEGEEESDQDMNSDSSDIVSEGDVITN